MGVYATAEEAARAYDRENLRLNGRGAITNFPLAGGCSGRSAAARERPAQWEAGCRPAQRLPRQHRANLVAPPARPNLPPADYSADLVRMQSESLSGREPTISSRAGRRSRPSPFERAGAGAYGSGTLLSGAAAAGTGGGSSERRSKRARRGGGADRGARDSGSETESPLSACGAAADGAGAGAAPRLLGVRRLSDQCWQARLRLDLGTYPSSQEAARAHDRAALLATGLTSRLNAPLPEAVAALAAAAAAGPMPATPGQGEVAAAGGGGGRGTPRLRGVVARGGAFIAMLDVAGKPYELGPFPSEADAARAYDRYSVLLHGHRCATAFWGCC